MSKHVEDVHQIVHMRALQLMQDYIENPDRIDSITSWVGNVKSHTRNDASRFQYSADGANPTGAVGPGFASKYRRVQRANSFRNHLRGELLRETTGEEVIAAANDDLNSRPSGATSKNMILTVDDLDEYAMSAAPIDEGLDAAPPDDPDDVVPSYCVLLPGESRGVLHEVIRELKGTHGRDAAELAKMWLAPSMGAGDHPAMTVGETCRRSGAVEQDVVDMIENTRQVAMAVLKRRILADPEALRSLEEYAREHGYSRLF